MTSSHAARVRYGDTCVQHALGFISAAKVGLSEGELEDILSCDEAVRKSISWVSPRICSRTLMGVLRTPFGAPHQCSLGTAASYLVFMLTGALLMTSSHSEGAERSLPMVVAACPPSAAVAMGPYPGRPWLAADRARPVENQLLHWIPPRMCSRTLMGCSLGTVVGGAPHPCSLSLGTAACYHLFLLTRALLMTSPQSKATTLSGRTPGTTLASVPRQRSGL